MNQLPSVVSREERVQLSSQQTPGIHREQAFTDDDRWVGYVRTEPGEWSGWHHHGDHDTYFYALRGRMELEYQTVDGRHTVSGGPGDFIHVPSHGVHRERTAPGEPGEGVLVRIGQGPAVFNVDEPAG